MGGEVAPHLRAQRRVVRQQRLAQLLQLGLQLRGAGEQIGDRAGQPAGHRRAAVAVVDEQHRLASGDVDQRPALLAERRPTHGGTWSDPPP
jgi:hypothetical protein